MIRLRPMLMTSIATIAGHFSLVLVAGAAARNSIGLALVGGMAVGTLFTLFVVPSLCVLMAKGRYVAESAEPDSVLPRAATGVRD